MSSPSLKIKCYGHCIVRDDAMISVTEKGPISKEWKGKKSEKDGGNLEVLGNIELHRFSMIRANSSILGGKGGNIQLKLGGIMDVHNWRIDYHMHGKTKLLLT